MPLDYSSVLPQNPQATLMQAMQMGAAAKERRAAAALAQQQAEAKAAADAAALEKHQQAVAALDLVKREPTGENYAALSLLLPAEMAKSVRETFSMLQEEKASAVLRDSSNVFAALKSDNVDMALRIMKEKAEAYTNNGDTDAAKNMQSYINILETRPNGKEAVEDAFGFMISMMPNGKEAIDAAVAYAADIRLEKEHPTLMAQKTQELAKARTEAEKADIELKYAERAKVAELNQAGAQLGLTEAQTAETIAKTNKLGLETTKLALELEQAKTGGALPPEQRFDAELKLNKEYDLRIQEHTEAKRLYEVISTAAEDGSGAGDVSLIFSFMKMLDPRSVVRESEFAQAQDTTGLIGKLQVAGQKVQSGQLLTPQQRIEFKRLADEYMTASNSHEQRVRADLDLMVQNYGLNPENIFGTKGKVMPGSAAEASQALTGMRDFLKRMWPAEAAKIDGMSEEALRREYPNSLKQYQAPQTSAAVEVDY